MCAKKFDDLTMINVLDYRKHAYVCMLKLTFIMINQSDKNKTGVDKIGISCTSVFSQTRLSTMLLSFAYYESSILLEIDSPNEICKYLQ